MYGLYDKEGILRFVNSEREACLDYAKLFELNSAQFSLIYINKKNDITLILNQGENNN